MPKKRSNEARAEFCQIFRLFFGQWSFKKKCFWDLQTFSQDQPGSTKEAKEYLWCYCPNKYTVPQLLLPMKTLFLIFIVSEIFPPFVICWVFTWHQIPIFFSSSHVLTNFFYNFLQWSMIFFDKITANLLVDIDRSVRKSRLVCWETVIRARLPTDAPQYLPQCTQLDFLNFVIK